MRAADKKTIEGYIDFTPRDKARDAFETASSVFKTAEAALANCPKPGDKTTSGTAAQEHGAPVCDHVELEKQLKKAQSDRSLRRDELQTQQDALDQRIKGRADALSNTGLHIGWDKNEFTEWHESFWTWPSFTKLVGLLVSAFAIALGAPFWFNMLKSVASMRSVGVNAGEKKDEGKAK